MRMRIGYAYAATKDEARALPAALRAVGADRAWIDFRTRDERAALFARDPDGKGVALRPGDVLVVLKRAHLGVSKEILRFEALAADMGVTIEVAAPDAPTPRKPGPAPTFPRTQEEERIARHWWQGPFRRADALREIEQRIGRRLTSAQLNKHIGPRGGSPDRQTVKRDAD